MQIKIKQTEQITPNPSISRVIWGSLLGLTWILALTTKAGLVLSEVETLVLSEVETSAQNAADLEIKVGVVQRFGEKPTDQIIFKALPGDRLTLQFLSGNFQPQNLSTDSVKLEIAMKPLDPPRLEERVVLGTYRSFEGAENNTQQWRSKGIEVEIAQPDRWQIWAKRDIYRTPLLRRMLLDSLRTNGNTTAYLDSKIWQQKPQANWVINGFRYNRNQLKITSGQGIMQISHNPNQDSQANGIYGGFFQLQPNAYGTYTLVNQVPVETYLRGVVPHEIGAAPYAAIEAQTILARTYALRNLRRFLIDDYEMCASTDCQVYEGLNGTSELADQAIAATNKQVLTYQNELVDALYSAATGGITASFNDIWNGPERPYLSSRLDAVDQVWDLSQENLADEKTFRRFMSLKKGFNESDSDLFRWQESATLPAITEFLKRFLQKRQSPLANFQSIQEIQIRQRSKSGRVLQVVVQTDRGPIEINKDDIRNAFEPPISTLFYLEPIYEDQKTLKGYTFVGGGYGHGIGLSQIGSYKLADLGWSSSRILSFYYPGTQVQSLNNSIVFWRPPTSPTH